MSTEVATHDAHLTYSRAVVEGPTIRWRVRLFRDDLEKALQAFAHNPTLKVGAPGADSTFAAYFNAQVPISANGRRLAGKLVQSGHDDEVTEQDMWWYAVELTSPVPVTSLAVRVGLLFEHFADQRNIVTLIKMPGETRHSLFFVRGDTRSQGLQF